MRCYICIYMIMTNPLWWDFRFRNPAEDKKCDKTTPAEKILLPLKRKRAILFFQPILQPFDEFPSDVLSVILLDPLPGCDRWMRRAEWWKFIFLRATPLQRFAPNDSDNFLCDLNTTIRITHRQVWLLKAFNRASIKSHSPVCRNPWPISPPRSKRQWPSSSSFSSYFLEDTGCTGGQPSSSTTMIRTFRKGPEVRMECACHVSREKNRGKRRTGIIIASCDRKGSNCLVTFCNEHFSFREISCWTQKCFRSDYINQYRLFAHVFVTDTRQDDGRLPPKLMIKISISTAFRYSKLISKKY